MVGSLVDKSLVRRDGERYAMLETIRGYALDRLDLSGEEPTLRDRHAAFFERLAAAAHAGPVSRRAARADELEREHDNLRAALDYLRFKDPRRLLRMAGQLGWFWHAHSHLAEGRRRMAEALAGLRNATRTARARCQPLAHWPVTREISQRAVRCSTRPSTFGESSGVSANWR